MHIKFFLKNINVFFLNDFSFEHDNMFTKILLLKTYQMRSLLIDWLLGNNYLRKRFCYFIFVSRQVICLFFHKLLSM